MRKRCATDAALGDSVLRLLSQFDRLGDFLASPATRPAESAFAPGQVLCGRFRILERIGAGGMGEVFRAEDRTLGEIVALKTIHSGLRADAAIYDRFRQEIRLARRVSHPNVCKIFDLFMHSDAGREPVAFFTMQYLPGESLAARIAAAAPFPRAEAIRIAAQIADGLDSAHGEGIVHRDLKPANVVLFAAPSGGVRPVITDFGLAHFFDSEGGDTGYTFAGQIVGSIDYMAPEQFEGAAPQPATDVFALGIMIFEMLTGQRPYPSESLVRSAVRRITMPPPSLRECGAEAPPHWERVIRKALARSPRDRYASAGAMIRDLELARSISILAPGFGPRPTRRTVVAGGAMLGAIAAYFAISRIRDRKPVLPGEPFVMLNPLTHAPNDAIEAGALDVILTNQFAQSSHLRLLSRERVERSWRLIEGAGPERQAPILFEPRMARDIAMRSGAQIVLFGSFSRAGDQRTLTLQAELMGSSPDRARSTLGLRHFDTNRASDLAGAGHEAAEWARRTIGETEQELEVRNRPPEDLTTPYWTALQEYVEADQSRAKNAEAAALHLRTALRIDPDFALAAARLGDILRAEGQVDEALEFWSRAAGSLGRRNLTDRESLRIRGLFANDIGQAAEAEQVFARYSLEYPADALPLLYRATALDHLGRYEEAERLHTLAMEREPVYPFLMGRATFYLSRGRLDDAEKDWRRGREINRNDWTDQIEMAIAFARGDARRVASSLEHLKSAGSTQARSRAFVLEACLHAERDDASAAEELLRAGIAFDRSMGMSTAAQWEKQLRLAELVLAHRPEEAARLAATVLRDNPGHCVRMAFGAVLAQAGQLRMARNCLVSGLPDWPVYRIAARRLEGEIALARRDFRSALGLFREAVEPPHMRTWPEFLLRGALAAGDRETAAETLERLFFAPGIYWLGAERNAPGFVRRAAAITRKWPGRERWAAATGFFDRLTSGSPQ
ncbi:MAG: serine/threonine-protein kinase [Bryobacteraceae bacterium]